MGQAVIDDFADRPRLRCETCQTDVVVFFDVALIRTGFLLYDPTCDRDVWDYDDCDRFACPHNKGDVHFSKMLHPMGSMGEEAPNSHVWDESDGGPF